MTAPDRTTDDFRALLDALSEAYSRTDALSGSLKGVEHSAALDLRAEITLVRRRARGLALVAGRLPPSEVQG